MRYDELNGEWAGVMEMEHEPEMEQDEWELEDEAEGEGEPEFELEGEFSRRIPVRATGFRAGGRMRARPGARPRGRARPVRRKPLARRRPGRLPPRRRLVKPRISIGGGFYVPGAQSSEYIRWVQSALNRAMDLRLAIDGVMGVETRSAIRSFQEKNSLPADGIVGPDTERALMDAGKAGASAAPVDQAFDQQPEPAVDQPPDQASDQAPDQPAGEWETEWEGEWEFETPFSFARFPKAVLDALKRGLEVAAINIAVATGSRNENVLSDLVFFFRHPERKGRLLKKGEPDFGKLSLEWLRDIRDRLVRPVLFKAFFAEYDRRTFPGPKIGIADNPNLTPKQKTDRLDDVRAMAAELIKRRDRRAEEALKGKVLPGAAISSGLRPVAERLSKVQLDLFREFISDGKGGIRFDVLQRAFEQFANGDLRNPALSPKDPVTGDVISAVGEPDGGFFFLFAEFAFVCVDSGIDRAEWSAILRTFVKSQEIFMHVYRPGKKSPAPAGSTPLPKTGPKLRGLDGYRSGNFNPAARSNDKRKERLRGLYDRLGVESLRQTARNNMLRAQRMP